MNKIFSILFAFLILLSGVRLTVATHFCRDKIAAHKVSLSGELASCGMEGTINSCPASGNHLTSHCCDNEVSVYAIENSYIPSYSVIKEFSQNIFKGFYSIIIFPFNSITNTNFLLSSVNPPGSIIASAVDLAGICIFRV